MKCVYISDEPQLVAQTRVYDCDKIRLETTAQISNQISGASPVGALRIFTQRYEKKKRIPLNKKVHVRPILRFTNCCAHICWSSIIYPQLADPLKTLLRMYIIGIRN